MGASWTLQWVIKSHLDLIIYVQVLGVFLWFFLVSSLWRVNISELTSHVIFCPETRAKSTIRCQDARPPCVALQSLLPTRTVALGWGWVTVSKELHHIQIHKKVEVLHFFCYIESCLLEYSLTLNVLWLIPISSVNCDYLPRVGKRICVGFGDKKWYCSETERCDCNLHLCFICPKDVYFLYGCFRKMTRGHQPNALLTDVAVALRVRQRVYHSYIKLSS